MENSAVVLIDHQPGVGLAVNSVDRTLLVNNVSGLAAAAKALGVPTVLSTIGAEGSVLVDPIFKEIQAIFPGRGPSDHLDERLRPVGPGLHLERTSPDDPHLHEVWRRRHELPCRLRARPNRSRCRSATKLQARSR